MITVFAAILLSATANRPLDGTLVSIENARPTKLMVNAGRQFQTFTMAERAVVERQTRFAPGGAATTTTIDRLDLTPGEYVRLEFDAKGVVKSARAVVIIERAKVRSASGSNVVLEDGTTLAIGSVLRFVTADGKVSAAATVHPGESVLLFRHPETRNIYRFSAEPHAHKRSETPKAPPG